MKNALLFSGTSNIPLASKLAHILNVKLGDAEITRFIDNECRVFVKDGVAGRDVFVVQSLSEVADQRLVELCLLSTALKSLGARRTIAVIPWMGYSKQDKAFRRGEAVSAALVAKFIEVAGFDRVITIELHSENVLPFFRIPVSEVKTEALLAKTLPAHAENVVVVSPDSGGKSRSERFAGAAGLPIVYLDKKRDTETGRVSVTGMSGGVAGRNVVIFDDIINTGATAVETSRYLAAHGAASILFLATHAVLAGNASSVLAESPITRVIVTDTIAIPNEKLFAKLSVVSVSSLLADAVLAAVK